MQVTIYEVAEKAEVSISTVSRVINNKPNIPEYTKRRVLNAIETLNFKPNLIARGMASKKVNLVEVFFSWHKQSPWFTDLLHGINKELREQEYGLLVNTLDGAAIFNPKEVHRRLFHNAVDGVLMIAPYLEEKDLLLLAESGVPITLIGYRSQNKAISFVDSDNINAASAVVSHLFKLGHTHISCITGPTETSPNAADRLEGYRQAMVRHQLKIPGSYVIGGDFVRQTGKEAMQKLLALPMRPTAVFACNDEMALGAWHALQEAGLTVGKDMALVGFDDMFEASKAPYSLTTVRQDWMNMGVKGVRILMDKIRQKGHGESQQVLVPGKLVVRGSCGFPVQSPKRKVAQPLLKP